MPFLARCLAGHYVCTLWEITVDNSRVGDKSRKVKIPTLSRQNRETRVGHPEWVTARAFVLRPERGLRPLLRG